MISKTSGVYLSVLECLKPLTEGLVVCLDPSIGSNSSQPGYAVFRGGQYICSGIFEINPRKSKPERLRSLGSQLTKLYSKYPPDVLVYEEIPVTRHGGSAESHASLLKAVGVILSIPGPDFFVGIYPVSWKNKVRETYSKSDENDAVEICWIVIQLAHEIIAETQKPVRGKKNGTK